MTLAPRSLAGRLMLLLVLAVTGAQLAAFLFFTHETSRLHRAAVRTHLSDQVGTLIRLIDALPPAGQASALAAFNTNRHRYVLGSSAVVSVGDTDPDAALLANHIARNDAGGATTVRLAIGERVAKSAAASTAERFLQEPDALLVSARLRDGRWLNAAFPLPWREPSWMRIGLYELVASIVAVLAVVWLARNDVIRPVRALAAMAARLGNGGRVPLLPERGPDELRALTAAFNTMQARLDDLVEDRTHMLVAIGHDLRTPIASLWLRAEMIDDPELRDAMIATVRQMREMIEAALVFARADAGAPRLENIDLAELAQSVIAEHRLLGYHVGLAAPMQASIRGDAPMLRRLLDNLVGNAVRYGGSAAVTIEQVGARLVVRVDDDGPGIAEDRLEDVFKPFNRLDDSRSEETGGIGLGLAVVRAVARAHGGIISLENRPSGGLRAEVVLSRRT